VLVKALAKALAKAAAKALAKAAATVVTDRGLPREVGLAAAAPVRGGR